MDPRDPRAGPADRSAVNTGIVVVVLAAVAALIAWFVF
jgi:hypothetical protein